MIVYVVRHAIAHDADPVRWPDDRGRPLTPEGEERFRRAARGLRGLVPAIDQVFSSELARAWRTAEVLHEEAAWPSPAPWRELEPDRPTDEATAALARQAAEVVAVVGHDPHLSNLVAYFTAGRDDAFDVELKKGGAACVEFHGAPSAGSGVLRWLVTPKILRSL